MTENKNELNGSEVKDSEGDICFIITPIGNDNSVDRRNAEGVIKTVLKPILENEPYNFKVVVAHEINDTGSITNQVFECVVNSKLVIANVTNLNPNVMYELGVRHAMAKPVITIFEEGTKLPFDISADRSIKYINDMHGVEDLKKQLTPMIDAIKYDEPIKDNPVINALKDNALFRNVSGEDKEQQMLLRIYERLDNIENKITKNKNNSSIIGNNNYRNDSAINYHLTIFLDSDGYDTEFFVELFKDQFFASAVNLVKVMVSSNILMVNISCNNDNSNSVKNIFGNILTRYEIQYSHIVVQRL